MSINKSIIITATAALLFGASSCRKFLNVNNNPNITQTVTVETLLPAAQLYVGSSVGVDLQITGSIWGQYWTQTSNASQYVSFEQYAPGQDAFSTPWQTLYSGAENFYQLYNLADSLHKKPYKAIALIMQAYTFQLITDAWGDAPFTQALKGQYINGHIVNPKYDSQVVVYNGIIKYIDSAKKLISTLTAVDVAPTTDDLIYGGDMNKWTHFANTLKLKMLVRMSEINPTGVQVMIDSFYASNPTFLGLGEDAKIKYGFSTANKSPLYAEATSTVLNGTQNLGGSKTCIDSMTSNSDPREYIFYTYAANGTVTGLTQGSYNISVLSTAYNVPSAYVAGEVSNSASANAPVNLLTSMESYLLQAEVVARGLQASSSGMADDSLYYYGIKGSFDNYSAALLTEWGSATAYDDYLAAGGYWTVYPTGGSTANKIKFIITQKWFSMCGNQAFESWTEWRRTGYPDFLIHPASSVIGNNRPVRFLYPTNESTSNANFPATGLPPLTQKVWWDIL